jgi:7-cyano-7-deazaguanine synthase
VSVSPQRDGVVLASGGLDSTTLIYWLAARGRFVIPLFLDYGQHCAEVERQTLVQVLPPHVATRIETLDISAIYQGSESRLITEANLWVDSVSSDDMYLPYRNLLFLSVGAAFAQSHKISRVYSAFINSNHAVEIDCSTEFFDRLSVMLSDYGGVKIEMPFRELTKYDVAVQAAELGVPIGLTYSCQISGSTPCGACPNCVERLEALDRLVARSGETLN